MTLRHDIAFAFDLALDRAQATAFVRDVRRSLARADFLEDLVVHPGSGPVSEVEASLSVNAALFGQQRLRFRSRVEPTARGARLVGLPLATPSPGRAEVSGFATVTPLPSGSRVEYAFEIAIHLDLPQPEKWGGRALLRMIEYTAAAVLDRISTRFPEAVQEAAREAEAAYA